MKLLKDIGWFFIITLFVNWAVTVLLKDLLWYVNSWDELLWYVAVAVISFFLILSEARIRNTVLTVLWLLFIDLIIKL